ncbi:MAG: hypothetical protein LBK94_05380 [Prevotellaceae bacterium]|jgi:hypothetical protein|nr:hypothetical protein [Prevotellaceae bacterium]
MKKLIYLITFALIVACCSKDDATPNYIDNKLIGEWELEYYYRDDDDNDINIDNAENYQKFYSAPHTVTFNADTACGFKDKYMSEYYINSYYVSNNNIHTTYFCEHYGVGASISDYLIGHPIQYRFKNNQLIIASKSISLQGVRCVFYGFYKRKS